MSRAGRAGREAWSVGLAASLRQAGLTIGTGQVIACQQALGVLDPADRQDRYAAGRACLVSRPDDLPVYDRVFARFDAFAAHEAPADAARPPDEEGSGLDAASDRDEGSSAPRDALLVAGATASPRERLRHRRFDEVTPEERVRIERMLDELHVALPRRRSRRREPGGGEELDLARTLERALETDGELVDRAWRRRRQRPRRLVVVLDVSGSMAEHARTMLRFAVAARRAADRDAASHVEVFAFGTRLTRLSDALAARDPDRAIATAADQVVDWDGGTRIGASLDRLVRVWGRRGLLQGAVVVIGSDGLERGDPALLASSLARLRRSVHRIVWVNPLVGDARFEPTQRGMAAALPHIDVLVAGHTLGSLEDLATTLQGLR